MKADTVRLRDIMALERRYVIPTFQRDYEWTEAGQWSLLFDDLDEVARKLGEARGAALAQGSSVAKAEKSVAPHFLGAVVCDQLPSGAKEIDLRALIDGQQRMTTLQLLLRGLLDVLIENDSDRLKTVRRMLENPDDVVRSASDKYKLWPRRRDREVWPVAMDDSTSQSELHEGHRYPVARKYFAQQFRQARLAEDGSDRTDDFVDAALDYFKLVMIDLEENDDAQLIFEVLNGRQTPLSASDLVKNLLFMRGELTNAAELDELYDKYWAPFDDPWWSVQVGTGHATRAHKDVLLSVWLTAVSGEDANIGHLYGQVRSYLQDEDRKTEEVLAEIAGYAAAYRAIYGVSDAGSKALKTSYARLTLLRIQSVVPLLAWLRNLPSSRMSMAEHERAVLAVESWVIRRTLVGAQTRGYNVALPGLLKVVQNLVHDPETSVAAAVVQAFADAPTSLAWPDDAQVRDALINTAYYNRLTQERIRMILGALDNQLRIENPHTEPAAFDYAKLEIEHVMPRSWQMHWPLTDPEDATALDRRQSRVNTVGNLTLVTGTFNKSVSNYAWSTKRKALQEQSALQLNGSLAGCVTWDEDDIEARSVDLASVACRVWPLMRV